MMKGERKTDLLFITLDRLGECISVPVRYSSKAKRIFIRIYHRNVELVLPNKDFNAGCKFLLKKEVWVRRKLKTSQKWRDVDLGGNTIPIFDKQYLLVKINSIRNNVQIKENTIYVESVLSRHNEILVKFLQNKFLLEVTDIVNIFSNKYNFKFSEIKITNSKTKWGSCSSKLVLRFNWRLVFAPLKVLNYVIIHEMCHLIEMNHSKSFWNLVASLCPEYKSAKLWLKENGFRLHQYGRLKFYRDK